MLKVGTRDPTYNITLGSVQTHVIYMEKQEKIINIVAIKFQGINSGHSLLLLGSTMLLRRHFVNLLEVDKLKKTYWEFQSFGH